MSGDELDDEYEPWSVHPLFYFVAAGLVCACAIGLLHLALWAMTWEFAQQALVEWVVGIAATVAWAAWRRRQERRMRRAEWSVLQEIYPGEPDSR